MADETKTNSSAADSILAETADLYKDEIDAVAEEPAEEVKEEAKEESKEDKKDDKKSKSAKRPSKKETKEEVKETAVEEKKDLPADPTADVLADLKEDIENEEAAEEPRLPEKSAAIIAIEEKEAAKLARKNEREQRQAAKRNAKRARLQALIDQCPNEYKPVSTSKFFWYGVLCNLPCIGFVITLLFSIFPINKNVKNFARAILIVYLISIILTLVCMIVVFFMIPEGSKNEIISGMNKIIGSFG